MFADSFGQPPLFNLMFSLFPVFFFLIFALFLGTIIFNIMRGVGRWSYNNKQPVLSVPAKVVAKRTHVGYYHGHHMHHHHHHHHAHSTYYATFEVESGDRMEFEVDEMEYGLLVEGDMGKLTFQGTRFLRFERYAADAHF